MEINVAGSAEMMKGAEVDSGGLECWSKLVDALQLVLSLAAVRVEVRPGAVAR